ncbi:MAG: cell division protein ZapA [Desulfuromonadaceae bacterium]|nr:cell division protein ZapA [Desulfuromonadaceae bacterium]
MKNVVHVTILGQKYAIKSDVSPEEVEKVAAFVNDKIREVVTATATVDSLQAMVLAFLNVASEYLQLRENQRRSEAEMARLLTRMDAVG